MERQEESFDLIGQIKKFFYKIDKKPKDGDILLLSGKYVAISEGRRYSLSKVKPMKDAVRLAKINCSDPRLTEAIIRESETIYPAFSGIFMAENGGLLQPNAGIDRSNVQGDNIVLYPDDPNVSALSIRLNILTDFGVNVGIVITDSRIYPVRKGTTGIAIGYSGIKAILDERGKSDLFGKPLKVTRRAIADQLATAAQLVMGESGESIPIVLVRGLDNFVCDRDIKAILSVKFSEDLYYSAIKNIINGV
ncbi:MAG: coenzyme F420-0:L-glutamate ligase [Conexivisphaerales archaeon]